MNSNNNKYILNKYFLKFKYCLNYIKIENIITFFYSKFTYNTLLYFKNYPKDFVINISFSYFFIRDTFFRILSKKDRIINVKNYLINNNLIRNHYYYSFFR